MPIPRFRDADGDYEIVLFCQNCGWGAFKDRVTMGWEKCRLCGGKLETRRIDYRANPYRPRGYG